MIRILALATLLMLATPASADRPVATAEQTIEQLERKLNDALSVVDVSTIDTIWSDDFVFVTPAGQIADKARRMAGLKPRDPSGPALVSTIDDMQIRIYGTAAVAIVKTTWRGVIDGKEIVDPYAATHVWILAGGRWKLVSAQVAHIEVRK